MAKKKKKFKLLEKDLTMFDNDLKMKKFIMDILRVTRKYSGRSMERIVETHSINEILEDILYLSSNNVTISTISGELSGRHTLTKTLRDLNIKESFFKERIKREKRKEKVTDKSLESYSAIKNKDIIMKEAIDSGKADIISSLMFSIKNNVDTLKFVVDALKNMGSEGD